MPRLLRRLPALLLIIASTVQPQQAAAEPFPATAAWTDAAAGDSQDEKKAEPPLTVQVKGRVVDRNGNELAGIEVTIEGLKRPVIKKTGSTGAYNFEAPPGKYKITAKAGGKTATIEADVAKSMELPALVLNIEE